MSRRAQAIGALLTGVALAAISGFLPWAQIVDPQARVDVAGTETTGGLAQALALAAAAGSLLIIVLGVRGRRVVGGLLGGVGVAMMLTGGLLNEPRSERGARVADATPFDIEPIVTVGVWPWVYALAGALLVAGAILTIAHSPRWPARTRRFERPDRSPPPTATDDPVLVWQAMDAGLDPTAEPDDLGAEPADEVTTDNPDVRKSDPGDTIRIANQSQQSSRRK